MKMHQPAKHLIVLPLSYKTMTLSKFILIPLAIGSLIISILSSSSTYAQTGPIKTNQQNLEKKFHDELDQWLVRAYEGDQEAQFKVGAMFANSQFNTPDYEQAVYWYTQAARQGHPLAQYNLGHQYLSGIGVEKSEKAAIQWWLEAAEQEHALAQFNVGRAYYLGIGLKENHDESRVWFERAAANGEPKSIDILKKLGWQNKQPDNVAPSIATTNSDPAPDNDSTGLVDPSLPNHNADLVSSTDSENENQLSNEEPTEAEDSEESNVEDDQQLATSAISHPLSIYTNPNRESVLVTILDNRHGLQEIRRSTNWVRLKSAVGFPMWVHGDFIVTDGDLGTITGSNVNARAVPIIKNNTIMGQLQKGETMKIIDNHNDWYRVISPNRLVAWAKAAEFDAEPPNSTSSLSPTATESTDTSANTTENVETPPVTTESITTVTENALEPSTTERDDNQKLDSDHDAWLFSQPQNNYTLQLASFNSTDKMTEFLTNSRLINNSNLYSFTARGKQNNEWTYLILGSFPNKEAAQLEKKNIGQPQAWVRQFGRLQQNRCVAWKTQLPTPKNLNKYCR